MRVEYYILVKKRPVVEKDIDKWAQWMDENNLSVANTKTEGSIISTVFVGANTGRGLFETVVYKGALAGTLAYGSTWEEAEQNHASMVERVRTYSKPTTGRKQRK